MFTADDVRDDHRRIDAALATLEQALRVIPSVPAFDLARLSDHERAVLFARGVAAMRALETVGLLAARVATVRQTLAEQYDVFARLTEAAARARLAAPASTVVH